jgi:hypothetical protein
VRKPGPFSLMPGAGARRHGFPHDGWWTSGASRGAPVQAVTLNWGADGTGFAPGHPQFQKVRPGKFYILCL